MSAAATSSVPATNPGTGSGNDSGFNVGDCISDTTQGWVKQPCSQAEDRILAVLKPAAAIGQAWTACMKYAAVRQGWSGGMGQTSDSLDGTVTYCMVTGSAVAAGPSGAPPAVSASNP